MLPVMNIRAANTGKIDLEENIVRVRDFGDWSLLEKYILDPAKDKGVVLLSFGQNTRDMCRAQSWEGKSTGRTRVWVSVGMACSVEGIVYDVSPDGRRADRVN